MCFGLIAVVLCACATGLESQTHTQFEASGYRPHPPSEATPTFDGTLAGYVALALKQSPQARAAFERWRAARLRISRSRRLPDPQISFGYFVRRVETRVGPQRFRVGLAQVVPWPSKLTAGADAAAERARGAAVAFEGQLLAIKRDVAGAYWSLWMIHQEHRLKSEHDIVLEALAGAVRGRVRTGAAGLADLNQLELHIARHHDHRGQHNQLARKASARLLSAIGVAGEGERLAAKDTPVGGVPARTDAELRGLARQHPMIQTHNHLAESQSHRASAARADRFPRIRLGIDYIETGEAMTEGVPDSGKDPLIVSAGFSIPLWAGSYSDAEEAARAAASAHRADREVAMRRTEGAFEAKLADLRDAQRRIELFETTLLPQAETTFQAVLGGYQSGRSTVTSMILAQRDLLDLQLEHVRARAAHARAWTSLEYIVGRELDSQEKKP